MYVGDDLWRVLVRAQQLSAEGEKLLADVAALLDTNSRALADNPVRTVRELLGTTRRFAMGIMHHFDTAGRVVRDGDFRRLPKP